MAIHGLAIKGDLVMDQVEIRGTVIETLDSKGKQIEVSATMVGMTF
jgi:hypothetical protein